jgi:RimJ/RimL family protein N-acetyltransferase
VAGYFEPNVGSGRVQEKAGLVPFGRIENYITWYLTGELCDCILNKIGREEYLENPIYRNLEINVREGRRR